MGSRITRLLGVICLLSLGGCSFYRSPGFREFEAGAKKAGVDLAAGKYAEMDYFGFIRSGTLERRALLKKNFGIEYIHDNTQSPDFVRGYNSVMGAASRSRFGDDYQERTFKQITPEGLEIFGGHSAD